MGQLAVGGKAADCQPVWGTMWVRQVTHILTHTFFSVFGAGGVTRTPDLLITNQLLYRLSYTSVFLKDE